MALDRWIECFLESTSTEKLKMIVPYIQSILVMRKTTGIPLNAEEIALLKQGRKIEAVSKYRKRLHIEMGIEFGLLQARDLLESQTT